ncbi:uncharacterized protein LOC134538560 isoform X4 [Bacillus rossius redtenbacheri]|uniref:uncharacterized protein LOC134538560 isoform X4 n=1 Tax=Bacillus rossius redtenbacheri TaxID=93214 RepID=UPI002FDE747C
MMAEGVCVDEDPVKPEPFETVFLPVKIEIETEDGADGGDTAESKVKVKEEIAVEDFQASEQLQDAASLSVCVESNNLLFMMEERSKDEKDSEPVHLGVCVEINNLPYTMEERSKDEKDSEPVHLGVCVGSSDLPYIVEERTEDEKNSELWGKNLQV